MVSALVTSLMRKPVDGEILRHHPSTVLLKALEVMNVLLCQLGQEQNFGYGNIICKYFCWVNCCAYPYWRY